MKTAALFISILLSASTLMAQDCSPKEAQVFGAVTSVTPIQTANGLECQLTVQVTSLNESGVCGLNVEDIQTSKIIDKSCSLQAGQNFGLIFSLDSNGTIAL